MNHFMHNRREFLRTSAGMAATGVLTPYIVTAADLCGDAPSPKNDQPNIGCIGVGWMGCRDLHAASQVGQVVAVCDVDRTRAEAASDDGKRAMFDDYRKLLDRKDIDIVTISTPDHWHTRIAMDALKAGKDIYCQKPLTLTIDEGKRLCKAIQQSGRVFQVGTQQRSNDDDPDATPVNGQPGPGRKELFLTAVAMCRLGRIGKIRRITCAVGGAPSGGPFLKTCPPPELNWNMWLGQAPMTEYIKERAHTKFRFWYEYSGGCLTDWGAHHVDIAQWAIGMDHSGPITIEPVSVTFPVPMQKGNPTKDDCFNAATTFMVKCTFVNGVELIIRNDTDKGILFEGDEGRFFVNRGRITGKPAERLADDPIPEDLLKQLRKGKESNSHMGNFIACVKDRSTPVSDAFSHHRTLTTCHLANIALRLGRKLTWNPEAEQIVGDDEANAWQSRPQRKGFEIEA